MLQAAGYSPIYGDRPLDDPTLIHVKEALETLLGAHEPCPGLTVDRHWNIVRTNRARAVVGESRSGVRTSSGSHQVNYRPSLS